MKSTPAAPRTIQVAILLPERVWAGAVFLTQELLLVAGAMHAHGAGTGAGAPFAVRLLSPGGEPVDSFGGVPIRADAALDDAAHYDVVFVPTQFAPSGAASAGEARMAAWIARRHARGALIVSLSGAVLLAKSGLLDGRLATGLKSEQALFERHFPQVRYQPGEQIVADGQIICAGGIGPTADVCAHVIERFHGRRLAEKFLRHTRSEALPAQAHLRIWSAQFKRHHDRQVLAAQERMERDIEHLPALAVLARQAALSERTLSRRFADAVGMSLRGYASLCRLELARQRLRDSDDALILIADACGYASTAALVRAFSAHFGVSPLRYRRHGEAQAVPPA